MCDKNYALANFLIFLYFAPMNSKFIMINRTAFLYIPTLASYPLPKTPSSFETDQLLEN
jgi:hypothetical protein